MAFIGWQRGSAREMAADLRRHAGRRWWRPSRVGFTGRTSRACQSGRCRRDAGDAARVAGLGFPLLKAPSRCRPQDHGSDRGLPRISQRRGGRPPQRAQSAGEDAGAVREIPALRGRARLPECLGREIRRRAGGRRHGRRRRPGMSAAATGRAIRCRSPTISAAIWHRPSSSSSTAPGSSGCGGGQRRRLIRRWRGWRRWRRLVTGFVSLRFGLENKNAKREAYSWR